MDSLTQIVLGAACGEAVLGKKIGNKALLLGAIGGTIPDLDVFVGKWVFNNQIDAMLFHRGFMHAILFSILAALLLGQITHTLHQRKSKIYVTKKQWTWLWFLSLFTHPLLDCFTPYGTQLFLPFSNHRVALNNIAVVDPLYTLPFLLCIIIIMCFNRTNNKRKLWLNIGFGISSIYMLLTLANKVYINNTFKNSLDDLNIKYNRYSTQPAIFNNLLWYGIAEGNTSYYIANYSLLDTKNRFLNVVELPKQRDLLPENFKDLKKLAWFSNGYYSVYKIKNNLYQYNDLRYPLLDVKNPNSSVFNLKLFKKNKRLDVKPSKPKYGKLGDVFKTMWIRIKGI